jgi:hypothetical protein
MGLEKLAELTYLINICDDTKDTKKILEMFLGVREDKPESKRTDRKE